MEGLRVETIDPQGRTALVDGVSLTLHAGEVLALVGASGSGKSMTCAACLDVLPPGTRRVKGSVSIDGRPCTATDLRGRQVASILQSPRTAFNPVRSMREHVRESLRVAGGGADAWADVRQAMRDTGLDDPERILPLFPFEMSGGMLQRMMIALALISRAPFIFADEPTTDLDLIVQREILDLLDHLKGERGLGILLVTHDMGVVARLADRVAVMEAGRIVETGGVMQIFHAPHHIVTRRLVEAHLSLYRQEPAA
nr:ATP-binding cassette domain-containing protein [Chelatococcus reniformis]